MAEQKAHINYSLEDIERYLNGKMSANEMHDMEKAALQDPFLAEAIEGYATASFDKSHRHLNEITAALQSVKEETKVLPLPSKRFYWWRIAAAVILVIGIGTVSWYIMGLNNKTELNKNVAQVQEKKNANRDTVTKDSVNNTVDTSLIAQNKSASFLQRKKKKLRKEKDEEAMSFSLADTQKSISAGLEVNRDSIITMDTNDALQSDALSAPPRLDTQKLAERSKGVTVKDKRYLLLNNNALNNFEGRVTDNNNQAIPNAIVIADSQRAVYTDANGYFKLNAPDSLLNVTVSSIGFVPRDTLLKSKYANNISIIPDKNVLSEVAVTAYGIKKESMKRKTMVDSAYPAGGWQSFQEYVYKKLGKPLDTLNDDEFTGDVEIEFSINENGVPYNFTILKSVTEETASKAIEIIKDGPRWITSSKNKKGRVTIQF